MRIRGYLEDHLFYLRTLTVCTVLSTGLLIYNQVNNILVENTSGRRENLKEVKEELPPRVIGSGITGHVPNSKKTLSSLERIPLVEKYYQCIPRQEK